MAKDGRITLRQRLEYVLLRTVFAVLARVPETLAYGAAGMAGALYLRVDKRRQRLALRQLRNALPGKSDRELLAHARRGTGSLLKVSVDMLRVARMVETGKLEACVDTSSFDEQGLTAPFVGVTAHLGSWELAAISLARRFAPIHATARLLKNPLATRWLLATRRRAGLVIHDRRGGVRGMSRALRDGHVVMQVVDQHQRLRGVEADWFGEKASCERGAATLAVRGGVPVAVGAAIRVGLRFRFKIHIEDVVLPEPSTGDREEDVRRLVNRINRALERTIIRYPDDYLWIHDRYRHRPETNSETTCPS